MTKQRSRDGMLLLAALLVTAVFGVQLTSAAYHDTTHAQTPSNYAVVPLRFPASHQVKTVDTAVALDADGHAWAWGRVGAGGDAGAALGGTAVAREMNAAQGYPRKVPIPGDPQLGLLAADRRTAIGVTADTGQVWVWGAGSFLHPQSTSQYTYAGYDPAPVMKADGSALDGVTMVAAAERNAAIAVDAEGTIWRWGNPVQGGVDGYRPQESPLPEGETGRPVSVSGGQYMVSTVLDNGNVYVWGSTTRSTHGSVHSYELPDNQQISQPVAGELVQGLQPWSRANNPDAYVVQVGFGGFDQGYGAALLSDGTLLSWGNSTMVAGHADPGTTMVVADHVVELAPNFYGVSYLRRSDSPTATGHELWGYGPANYALGNGREPVLVDTDVISFQSGMAFNFWMRLAEDGSFDGVYGRGYNAQGAVGLNSSGTPQTGESTRRLIQFPGKDPADLSFLGG